MTDAVRNKARRHRKVSRLPPLPDPPPPQVAAWFERMEARGNSILNLHVATAHAPSILAAKSPLAMALRNECVSSRLHRELAIVRVGHLMECAYELDHHAPLLVECGMSQRQADAVGDWRANAELFDEKCRAILAFVDAMVGDKGRVDDATFSEFARHFSPQEIVEIAYNAVIYVANALIVNSLRIQLDEPHVRTTPGKF